MFKKLSLFAFVLCLIIPSAFMFCGCGTGKTTINVSSAAELREKLTTADANSVIVLQNDITLSQDDATQRFVATKKVTLDLNGKTIQAKVGEGYDGTNNSLFSNLTYIFLVDQGGDLTVTGNGTVDGKTGDVFAFNVKNGGKLTIQNGTFAGSATAVQVDKGQATINGGSFSVLPAENTDDERYLLNLIDANGADGSATITVYGGEFEKFNPSDNLAENPKKNFVAEGYKVVQSGTKYIVQKA